VKPGDNSRDLCSGGEVNSLATVSLRPHRVQRMRSPRTEAPHSHVQFFITEKLFLLITGWAGWVDSTYRFGEVAFDASYLDQLWAIHH